MSITIHQGDILAWAAQYDGEPFHALLCDPPYHLTEIVKRFGSPDAAPAQYGTNGAFQRALGGTLRPLYLGISTAVAGIAEGGKVRQIVRLFVTVKAEQSKRLNVMHISAGGAAVLAGVVIALQRLAPLSLPVRAALFPRLAADVLRVIEAVPVGVAALPRAILAAALALAQHAFIRLERLTAVEAGAIAHGCNFGALFQRGVLTSGRAMLAAPMLQPRRNKAKCLAAVIAR